MKASLLKKTKAIMAIFCALLIAVSGLVLRAFAVNREQIDKNYDTLINANALQYLEVETADGVILFQFGNENKGYADDEQVRMAFFALLGNTINGIHNSILSKTKEVLVGDNNTNTYYHPKKLTLTIDSQLQVAAYNALCGADSDGGAIMVANYQTGEILCAATAPGLDPLHPDNPPDESYLFKPICAFTPGSVMKTVSVAAVLENNYKKAMNFSYHCNKTDGHLTCVKAHGDVDLAHALSRSCNCGIAQFTTNALSAKKYEAFIDKIGLLNLEGQIADFSCSKEGKVNATGSDYQWTVNGQAEDLVTPAAMLRWYCAIANDGTCVPLHLYSDTVSKEEELISSQTSTFLRESLYSVVGNQLPVKAWGKTGTAQLTAEKSDDMKSHSWFICALDDENAPPICCLVMLEHGGSSGFAQSLCVDFLNNTILK